LQEGEHVPATICDHVIPHNGDEKLFWLGDVQSLCAHHHESKKQREEKRGYNSKIGVDGWPVDPMHPANNPNKPIPPRTQRYHPRPIDIASKLIIG
jgi:hypothetical protein